MIIKKLHERISALIRILQRFTDRLWYGPFIGFLAALDNFVVVIPNDGILISSTMLIPRRWFLYALCVTIGSVVGALLLAAFVNFHGLPWILNFYPSLQDTQTWIWTQNFFEKFGLYLVFIVAVTPLAQQPAVVLASLAGTPLLQLTLVIFLGRAIKFLVMAYIGSHAPKLLTKIWGVREELEEAGVHLEQIS